MDIDTATLAGPVTCIRLNGRLDAAGADQVGLRFTAAVAGEGQRAIVDLGAVSFIASMGLRLLIGTARNLAMKGGTLVLFGAGEMVQGVLEDAAIDQIVPVVATEAEALARARPTA